MKISYYKYKVRLPDQATIYQIVYCGTVGLLRQLWPDNALANSELYANIRAMNELCTIVMWQTMYSVFMAFLSLVVFFFFDTLILQSEAYWYVHSEIFWEFLSFDAIVGHNLNILSSLNTGGIPTPKRFSLLVAG